MAIQMAMIELKNISKVYPGDEGNIYALREVELAIPEGDFAAIIGSSGSGKSTLMNILGGLDAPDSGQYFLDGEEVEHLSEQRMSEVRNRKIGFIFQGFNLIPSLTAMENVELPLIYRRLPKDERRFLAIQALDRMGLSPRAGHLPAQLSGGQQQRVAIARAIAAKPPLILADEPTGNLDSKTSGQVMEILTSLHREGRTLILITHDDQIAKSARSIYRMKDGCLLRER